MIFDSHTNFAYSTLAVAPSPATSGTSLTLQSGDGAKMPAAPFNGVIWPTAAQPLTTNAEIVRVTAVVGDTLTIVRNTTTENNNAFNRTALVGDQFSAGITWKMITDIENAINANVYNEVPSGSVNGSNTVFTLAHNYSSGTARVFLNGLRQIITADYSESAINQITFVSAPLAGDYIIMDYVKA